MHWGWQKGQAEKTPWSKEPVGTRTRYPKVKITGYFLTERCEPEVALEVLVTDKLEVLTREGYFTDFQSPDLHLHLIVGVVSPEARATMPRPHSLAQRSMLPSAGRPIPPYEGQSRRLVAGSQSEGGI